MATQVAEETIKNVALHFSMVTYALGCLSYRPADSLWLWCQYNTSKVLDGIVQTEAVLWMHFS